MNKAARNERRKLTATWLNGGAIAALAVGCFAPITSYATSMTAMPVQTLGPLVVCWLAISAALHLLGRSILGRLEE